MTLNDVYSLNWKLHTETYAEITRSLKNTKANALKPSRKNYFLYIYILKHLKN